ncbi:hypothetical protein JW979_11150 [bacterium]|nr:hypothetical protein [candidate division CSSED10-310 bacterium]
MAKDQFKVKTKVKDLVSRFSVIPLVEKGSDFLCVDANFNFLLVSKAKLEQYAEFALPETFDKTLSERAREAARQYLPGDQGKIDALIQHLKQKGIEGFGDVLAKALEN